MLGAVACGDEREPWMPVYLQGNHRQNASVYEYKDPSWRRHHNSSLKILAIGNSFTINATTYLPLLLNNLNNDSICIARLTRSGCSLKMHWNNYETNSPDYDFYYSDQGKWRLSEIKTINEALRLFDWDIITIQQVSGYAGVYKSFQPYLDNLVGVFHAGNPDAKLAWHYTWAYTPWTKHPDFSQYDCDSEKMYESIIDACDKASANFDIKIPSATLIKRMREEYPEVENGFSEDGYHIVDDRALYALSTLWYEVLVRPYCGLSGLENTQLPYNVSAETMQRAFDIIKDLTQGKN